MRSLVGVPDLGRLASRLWDVVGFAVQEEEQAPALLAGAGLVCGQRSAARSSRSTLSTAPAAARPHD
jgi:hypothetical protein